MEASDTGEIEAVHLEHLDVKSMSKLNQIIGALKRMVQGNARITLTLSQSGTSLARWDDTWKTSKLII